MTTSVSGNPQDFLVATVGDDGQDCDPFFTAPDTLPCEITVISEVINSFLGRIFFLRQPNLIPVFEFAGTNFKGSGGSFVPWCTADHSLPDWDPDTIVSNYFGTWGVGEVTVLERFPAWTGNDPKQWIRTTPIVHWKVNSPGYGLANCTYTSGTKPARGVGNN